MLAKNRRGRKARPCMSCGKTRLRVDLEESSDGRLLCEKCRGPKGAEAMTDTPKPSEPRTSSRDGRELHVDEPKRNEVTRGDRVRLGPDDSAMGLDVLGGAGNWVITKQTEDPNDLAHPHLVFSLFTLDGLPVTAFRERAVPRAEVEPMKWPGPGRNFGFYVVLGEERIRWYQDCQRRIAFRDAVKYADTINRALGHGGE